MPADNTHHLIAAAARRRTECVARVQAVLDDLERTGGAATVTAVARRANVSRTFLHDSAQAALLARLQAINAGASNPPTPVPAQQRISESSHQQIVRALRQRNKRLVQENAQLRAELATALGQLRELRRAQTVARHSR
jgi:hypothetical protein